MDKWSLLYEIINTYFKIPQRFFFKRIIVEGLENVPKNKPIIFAPNHQNAILDPLVIIYTTNKQPVFLARGDAFNNKTIAKIFATFKIMPVYRQRDGLDQLKKNEEIFQKSVDVLKNSRAFCLFPEGQHNPQRFLRPLQKAIPRIAFQAEEQTDFNLDIKIIPTGIYYQDKTKSLKTVHIQYGKPINVLDFVEAYKENPQKGMNALKIEMTKGLSPLMIDIQDKENYDLYEDVLELYVPKYLRDKKQKNIQVNRFRASKKIISKLGLAIEEDKNFISKISPIVSEINVLSKDLSISKDKFAKPNKCWLTSILLSVVLLTLSPLFIIGWVINILPHQAAPYISKNLLKDPQYLGSVKFGVGSVIFPTYYFILFGLSFIFLEAKYAFAFLAFLPVVGLSSLYYISFVKTNMLNYKYLYLNEEQKNIIKSKLDILYKIVGEII